MNIHQKIITLTIKSLIVIVLLAIANITVFGQLPNDSSLRIWLKADTLTGSTVRASFRSSALSPWVKMRCNSCAVVGGKTKA